MTNVPSTFPKPADIDDSGDDATTKYDALSLDVGVVNADDRQQELELKISTSKWRAGGVGVGPVAKFSDLEMSRPVLRARRKSLLGFSPDGRKSP